MKKVTRYFIIFIFMFFIILMGTTCVKASTYNYKAPNGFCLSVSSDTALGTQKQINSLMMYSLNSTGKYSDDWYKSQVLCIQRGTEIVTNPKGTLYDYVKIIGSVATSKKTGKNYNASIHQQILNVLSTTDDELKKKYPNDIETAQECKRVRQLALWKLTINNDLGSLWKKNLWNNDPNAILLKGYTKNEWTSAVNWIINNKKASAEETTKVEEAKCILSSVTSNSITSEQKKQYSTAKGKELEYDYIVGPFYFENIDSLLYEGDNDKGKGKQVSVNGGNFQMGNSIRFADLDDNTILADGSKAIKGANISAINNVSNKHQCYILLTKDEYRNGNFNLKIKLTEKIDTSLYAVDLWLFNVKEGQNFLVYNPYTTTDSTTKEYIFNYTAKGKNPGRIMINKVDEKTGDIISGEGATNGKTAEFYVYNIGENGEKYYIKEDDTNADMYVVSEAGEIPSEAKLFKTDKNGQIIIENVLVGNENSNTFVFQEITPPEGYQIASEITEVNVNTDLENMTNAIKQIATDTNFLESHQNDSDDEFLKQLYLALLQYDSGVTTDTIDEVLEESGRGLYWKDKIKENSWNHETTLDKFIDMIVKTATEAYTDKSSITNYLERVYKQFAYGDRDSTKSVDVTKYINIMYNMVDIKNTPTTTIRIRKRDYDDKSKTLEGFGFLIQYKDSEGTSYYVTKDNSGNAVYSIIDTGETNDIDTKYIVTTDDTSGNIELKGCLVGEYTIEEISIPSKYLNIYVTGENNKYITDNYGEDGFDGTYQVNGEFDLTIYNKEAKGNLKITKIDANNKNKLKDVEFKIKRSSTGEWVKQDESNGEITYVKEVETETIIDENGNDTEVTTTNTIPTIKTDANGEINLNGLVEDTYEIYEVNNPNVGYISQVTSEEPIKTVEVNIGKTTEETIENISQTYNLIIEKADQDGKTITDVQAQFNIIKNGKEVVMKNTNNGVISLVEGMAENNQVINDVYTITEESAPAGYIRFKGTITITVAKKQENGKYIIDTANTKIEVKDENGVTLNNVATIKIDNTTGKITLKLKNTEKKGNYNLELVKVDESGNTITGANAKFSINGEEKTTSQGKITIEKQVTKEDWQEKDVYTIKETEAPNGYVRFKGTIKITVAKTETEENFILDKDKTRVEVMDENGNSLSDIVTGQINLSTGKITLKLKNTEKKGNYNLELIKVDESGNTITETNAKFSINGEEKTTSQGKITIEKQVTKEDWQEKDVYTIKETEAPNGYVRFKGTIKITVVKKETEEEYIIDKNNIKMEVKDENNNIISGKAGIRIDEDTGQITVKLKNQKKVGNYKLVIVKQDQDGKKITDLSATFNITKNKVTSSQTTKNGEISLDEKIDVDNIGYDDIYTITEKSAPTGYAKFSGTITIAVEKEEEAEEYAMKAAKIEVDGKQTDIKSSVDISNKTITITVKNEKYATVSGYVWLENIAGKEDKRNNLYDGVNSTDYKWNETGKKYTWSPVIVKLKKNGQTVATTTMNGENQYEYSFDGETYGILLSKIQNYYVEFLYDGLRYQNVPQILNKTNGSKASEKEADRTELNEKYATQDANSEKYDKSSPNSNFYISASTANLEKDEEAVKYMNLGLVEREQPDLAVIKDVYSAKVSINGHSYVYNYASRFKMLEDNQLDFGIKWKQKYTGQYTQPIYNADAQYDDVNDSNELKVCVTYRIAIKNEATSLKSRVNNIVDYYDSRYKIVGIGTGLDSNTITGNLSYVENGQVDIDGTRYNKILVFPSQNLIESQTVSDNLYIQFELSRDVIQEMLREEQQNEEKLLDNIVEINSHTTYDKNGKPYAGRDKDSSPGNYLNVRDEDDTDKAPLFRISNAGERRTEGIVFEDSQTPESVAANTRVGNGIYDSGESGISGIKVSLVDLNGNTVLDSNGNSIETTTSDDGKFYLSGFISGEYQIKYEWGDSNYNVRDYKGTIYPEPNRQSDNKWYRKDVETRYSDAMDDYEIRKQIDGTDTGVEIKYDTNFETTDIKMNSKTPLMSIEIENGGGVEERGESTERPIYNISNVDFGIIKRPEQQIKVDKRISKVQLSLGNGVDVINTEIDENNKFASETKGMVYEGNVLKIELDNELVQSSELKVQYKIKVENSSEIDYVTEAYYLYGIVDDESKMPTLKASGVIDYLDDGWAISNSSIWKKKKKTELTGLISEEVINSTALENKLVLYTEELDDETLKPNSTNGEITLDVSKVLANKKEIYLLNDVEIVKVKSSINKKLKEEIPGNYVPSATGNYDELEGYKSEADDDYAAPITVIPPTGENKAKNDIVAITAIVMLVSVGTGVIFIKKKVLNK